MSLFRDLFSTTLILSMVWKFSFFLIERKVGWGCFSQTYLQGLRLQVAFFELVRQDILFMKTKNKKSLKQFLFAWLGLNKPVAIAGSIMKYFNTKQPLNAILVSLQGSLTVPADRKKVTSSFYATSLFSRKHTTIKT